jgi:hypothetical protein
VHLLSGVYDGKFRERESLIESWLLAMEWSLHTVTYDVSLAAMTCRNKGA